MRLPDRLLAQSGFHLRGIPIRGYAVILQESTSMFRARPSEKVIIEFTDPNQRAKAKGTVIRTLIGGASTFGLLGEKQEKIGLIKFWLMYGILILRRLVWQCRFYRQN